MDPIADEIAILEQTILADIVETQPTWGVVHQTGQGDADSRLWPVAVQRNPRLHFTTIVGIDLQDDIRPARVVDVGGDSIAGWIASNRVARIMGIL